MRYGRGAVLTVDLTNRCNMMCNPCFMDANQVGLRPRARVGRHQGDPRQRGLDQAAAADVRPVLGRRADDLAPLPRGDALRARDRLLLGPVRDERHPLRAGARVREGRVRGGAPARLPPVRRRRERAERAPRRREPVRRQAPRARQPPRGRDRRHARDDDRQHRQQRPGRRHHPVRRQEHRQDQRGLVPARLLHGPRRGDRRRDAQEAALHALAPRARREGPGGRRRADARLVPALGLGALLGPARTSSAASRRSGARSSAAATRTAASRR